MRSTLDLRMSVVLVFAWFLAACGGSSGGGNDDGDTSQLPVQQFVSDVVRGRWSGTVAHDPESCDPPNGLDLAGHALTYDVFLINGGLEQILEDQDGVLYGSKSLSVESDNSLSATSNGQPNDDGVFTGPTSVEFGPNDGNTAQVTLEIQIFRGCTAIYSGTFTHVGASPSDTPDFANVRGTWTGTLPVVFDQCGGAQPLQETHHISFDNLSVSLISTDQRLLTGFWQTVTGFVVNNDAANEPGADTVLYRQIENGTATVTINHLEQATDCVTSWAGQMRLSPPG